MSRLTPSSDPQGQGREGPREDSQGGDGCQARKDQGCPGAEAGSRGGEAPGASGRGVGDTYHDSSGKAMTNGHGFYSPGRRLLSFGICGPVFVYVRVICIKRASAFTPLFVYAMHLDAAVGILKKCLRVMRIVNTTDMLHQIPEQVKN